MDDVDCTHDRGCCHRTPLCTLSGSTWPRPCCKAATWSTSCAGPGEGTVEVILRSIASLDRHRPISFQHYHSRQSKTVCRSNASSSAPRRCLYTSESPSLPLVELPESWGLLLLTAMAAMTGLVFARDACIRYDGTGGCTGSSRRTLLRCCYACACIGCHCTMRSRVVDDVGSHCSVGLSLCDCRRSGAFPSSQGHCNLNVDATAVPVHRFDLQQGTAEAVTFETSRALSPFSFTLVHPGILLLTS